MTRDLTEDPVPREQRHDHKLREQSGLHAFHHAPSQASGFGLAELQCPHQAEAADLLHGLMRLHEGLRELEQSPAERLGPRDELCLVQLAQRREPGCHREVVRSERRPVTDGVLERVEHSVVHLPRHQQCPHRDVAARE